MAQARSPAVTRPVRLVGSGSRRICILLLLQGPGGYWVVAALRSTSLLRVCGAGHWISTGHRLLS